LTRTRSSDQDLSTLSRSLMDLQIETLKKQVANKEDRDSANSAQRLLDDLYANMSFYLPRDFREVGDYDRAIFVLKIAIEIDPERRRAQWGLAQAYATTGQEKKAFETLRRAVALGQVDVERLETDPTWDTLRKKPVWQEILEAAKSASN
jgi:tetratricopeptide (TPR) repeat protein